VVDARGDQEPARDRRPEPHLRRWAVLAAAAALVGCGSGQRPEGPRLARDLAQSLATRADALAAAHDGCSAQRALERLRAAAIAAVNAHRVPAAFQEELLGAVNRLTAPACARPAAAAPAAASPARAERPHGKAKAKGHAKGPKKHGKGGKHER
jgi:hypothetical protein